MAIEVFNRYEKKFLMDTPTFEAICSLLQNYMDMDLHNQYGADYTISNLYYDTPDNRLIRTSLQKPEYKEKLRLRAYGVPTSSDKVFVEIKKKVGGIVNKRRTKMKLSTAYNFLSSGKPPRPKKHMNLQVVNEIAYMLSEYSLSPKLYLAYDRLAFFGKNNRDLRISFDTNIRTRRYDLALELGDYGTPLLEKNVWLMEVKAEKAIPYWLSQMLSSHRLYATSFSKYGTEYKHYLLNQSGEERNTCLTACLIPQLTQHYPLAQQS